MNKKILIISIIVIVIIIVVTSINIIAWSKLRSSNQPLTADQALKIFKADARCGNPDKVDKVEITTDFDQMGYGVPRGEYWESDVFTPSEPGPGPSNGCWVNCYIDVNGENTIYHGSGCV